MRLEISTISILLFPAFVSSELKLMDVLKSSGGLDIEATMKMAEDLNGIDSNNKLKSRTPGGFLRIGTVSGIKELF